MQRSQESISDGTPIGPGAQNVSLACFTITGDGSGSSPDGSQAILHIKNVSSLEDKDFNDMNLAPADANLTVTLHYLYPLPNYTHVPNDLDGDGLYEDVNGDGVANFADVIACFQNYDWIRTNEWVGFFDFNLNGHFDLADTIGLFRIIYPV